MSNVSTADAPNAIEQILTEAPITISEACKALKEDTGRRYDRSVVYRWCTRGVRDAKTQTVVKLDHVKIGRNLLTSRPALTRFIEARSR